MTDTTLVDERIYNLYKQIDEIERKRGEIKLNGLECTLCHEYVAKKYYVTSCAHIFHKKCITNHFVNNKECPKCDADNSKDGSYIKSKFIIAVNADDINHIKEICTSGINLNIYDDFFIKTLIENDKPEMLELFIRAGAEIEEYIQAIIKNSSKDMIDMILQNHTPTDIKEKNMLLKSIIERSDSDIFESYLEITKDIKHENVLTYIISKDNLQLFDVLYKKNIDKDAGFLLYAAIKYLAIEIEKYLKERGAAIDTDKINEYKHKLHSITPGHHGCSCGLNAGDMLSQLLSYTNQ